MMDFLKCSKNCPGFYVEELKRYGLIRETRIFECKPNRLYLYKPENLENPVNKRGSSCPSFWDTVSQQERHRVPKSGIPTIEKDRYRNIDKEGGGKAAQDPPKKKHGDKFKRVELTDAERIALETTYGETVTADYINRMDAYLAAKGNAYRNHYAALVNWIMRDKVNPAKNRFNNFSSHDFDFTEYEKMEREQLRQKYGEDKP